MNAWLRGISIGVAVFAVGIGAWAWLESDSTDDPDRTDPSRIEDTDGDPSSSTRSPRSSGSAPTDERGADGSGDESATATDRIELDPTRTAPSVTAGATTAIVEGRVVADGGRAIAGAVVSLVRVGAGLITVHEPTGASVRTDGAGRFAFEGVPVDGPLALVAEAPGFASARADGINASAGATTTVRDLVLTTGVRLTGRVRSAVDGKPVPAARIAARLVRSGVPADPLGAALETVADAQGDYRLDGLAPETYRFEVRATDFVDTTVDRSFFAARTRKDATFDLALDPSTGSLAGLTLDAAAAPLADVTIVATATRKPGVTHRIEARSNRTGEFTLDRLGPWEYSIEASSPHHTLPAPVVARALDRTVQLTLARKARLSGTVRFDSGSGQARVDAAVLPRPGATALLFAQVPVGADGSFVIEDVPSGDIVLDVASDVGAPTRFGPVAVTAGSDVTGIDLLVTRGSVATGRVLRPDGSPAADASVVLLPAAFDVAAVDATLLLLEGTQRKNARCDSAGAFELAGLPDGSFRARATQPGFAPAYSAVFSAGSTPRVELGTLRLAPATSIGGRIVDAGGNGVGRAIVRASAATGEPGGVTASDAAGNFRFDGLGGGRWTIRAVLPHGRLGALDEVGEVEVDSDPAAPALVTIRLARRE